MRSRILLTLLVATLLSNCKKSGTADTEAVDTTPRTLADAYTVKGSETLSGVVTVNGDINVPAGTTLTIKPGTRLSMAEDATIDVDGALVIAGTAANPVRMYSSAAKPSSSDWYGIDFTGTQLDVSYLVMSDALDGFFLYSAASAASIRFDHCLFDSNADCIIDFTDKDISITNSSFINNSDDYSQWGGGKKTAIDACTFESTYFNAIDILTSSSTNTRAGTLTVTKSNFLKEGSLGFIRFSTTFPPVNRALTISGSHGITSTTKYPFDRNKGNSFTIQSAAGSTLSGIGSGLSVSRGGRRASPLAGLSAQELAERQRTHDQRLIEKNHLGSRRMAK
jgi:hypothetical protein